MKRYKALLSIGLMCTSFLFVFGAVHAQEEYDVRLVSQESVYSHEGLHATSLAWGSLFTNVRWIGDKFVLTGGCWGGTSGGGSFGPYKFGSGGLYVLDESGSFVDKRNRCFDAGVDSFSQPVFSGYLGHNKQNISTQIYNLGNGQVVTSGGGEGLSYPPLLYDVSGNTAQLLGQTYSLSSEPAFHSVNSSHDFAAVAGNRYFEVIRNWSTKGIRGGDKVGMFSLPEMELVNEYSSPCTADGSFNPFCDGTSGDTTPEFLPIIGVGDYFVAYTKGLSDKSLPGIPSQYQLSVYRVDGNDIELVQHLGNYLVNGYAVDVLNPNRVALLEYGGSGESPIHIYTAGQDGLELETSFERPISASSFFNRISLRGSDFSYISKPIDGTILPGLAVERDGEELSVEPLPKSPSGERLRLQSVAFSSTGKLMLTSSNAYVYLYELSSDSSDPTDPSTSTSTPQPQQVDINALMRQYGITPLRDYNFQDTATNYSQSFSNTFFNSNDTNTLQEQSTQQNTYTLNRPPQTIAEIRAFQCAYNIVCEGSIATTGYGNLGPKTQAKINEVFGQDGSVNGTQTTRTYEEIRQIINQLLQQVERLRQQLGG